ncbi:hypothetical protein DAPPUDRAFT_100217 [Daphnia pulex]|uniref:Uncharacterized protein n=1 Tax=Daphnia pulex TaxID=6669 RepID=E9G9S7_DAPPU|nr:hypothetical protein DAPPUDRAFT_100217 [Daphnia pulex]|eukprot:EFX83833.1 hypothetical protein DAPPUDRAFT_100217 [Daphnia pulex]
MATLSNSNSSPALEDSFLFQELDLTGYVSDPGVKWHRVHISGSTFLYTPPDINFTCDISSRTAFGLQVRPPLYQTGKGCLVVSAHIDEVPRLRIAEDGVTDIAIKLSYLQWSGHLYSRLVFTVYGRQCQEHRLVSIASASDSDISGDKLKCSAKKSPVNSKIGYQKH